VDAVLSSLIDSGRLAVTDERYRGNDALVVLESPALRMRIIRDRGQVSVEFGPVFAQNTWVSGDWLLTLLDEKGAHPFVSDTSSVVRMERLGEFVEQNLERLEELFSPSVLPSTQRTVAEVQEESARQRFGFSGKEPGGR
jgi:hypothetical protein